MDFWLYIVVACGIIYGLVYIVPKVPIEKEHAYDSYNEKIDREKNKRARKKGYIDI